MRNTVRDRDAVGGLTLCPDGVTVYTAAGAGSTYRTLLTTVGGGPGEPGHQGHL